MASRTSCVLAALAIVSLVQPAVGQDKPADALPLSKVVLFNSGVGFFQHDAKVRGDQQVELKFNVNDVNDLLKSMVLQDLGGGRIAPVTYSSMDPVTKTLRTFSIDLTTNPTLFDLLSQVRGEKVEVETPSKIAGTILGLERRPFKVDKELQQVEYLNLLTEDGIRNFPLASLSRIKLLNPQLDADLRQALVVLATGQATDKKTVTLQFLGQGTRDVRVGYIQESPIWKTSYRLVLSDQEAPFLQGWAIVENTTEQDWKDVRLTLVSGRPISFVMDLYQPLYVPRPVVEPELFASLRPQTYGQDMNRATLEFAEAAKDRKRELQQSPNDLRAAASPAAPMAKAALPNSRLAGQKVDGFGGTGGGAGGGFGGAVPFDSGVATVADAEHVGELFQYAIETPVTLARQRSAMLPIVNGSVRGEKLSIYNRDVHAKHPLNGLRLVNSTGLHLMQGPITVLDDGAYAGDARIDDLPPESERLISYAMDLDVEVASEGRSLPDQLVSVKIVKGILSTVRKLERSQIYTVKNSGKKVKQVLIEQPLEPDWKLVAPAKAAETTRDRRRFQVTAKPGLAEKLTVTEEQVLNQQVAITNLNHGAIQIYLSSRAVGDKVKEALQQIVDRKLALEKLQLQLVELQNQIKVIDQEQNRIRQNMQQLDRNSDLYNRYVKKFGEQEDQVEKLRGQIQQTQQKLDAERNSFNSYLAGLDVS